MIVTMHEISELRRVLSELSRLEQVQEIAEAASGTGHAVLDLAAEVVHFSGGARRLLGFPEGVMCVPLEASLALFGVDAGEEPALALDDLREGHRLPVSIETDVILIEGHVVRLRIDVCSRTDAASGSRFVVALLTRPGAARLSAGA